MLASEALSIARRRRGLALESAPPSFAATVISLITRVNSLPRLASWRPLRCWMFAHLLCPAIAPSRGDCACCAAAAVIEYPHRRTRNSSIAAMPEPLLIARNNETELHLLPAMGNRHGLVT